MTARTAKAPLLTTDEAAAYLKEVIPMTQPADSLDLAGAARDLDQRALRIAKTVAPHPRGSEAYSLLMRNLDKAAQVADFIRSLEGAQTEGPIPWIPA